MKLPSAILTWYDQHLKLWCAAYHDEIGNQIGSAGFGPSKRAALEDLKYQATLYSKEHK